MAYDPHNVQDTKTGAIEAYNNPTTDGTGTAPTSGQPQRLEVLTKLLLRQAATKMVFAAMGEDLPMTPNMGKTIKMQKLLPLLHSENTAKGQFFSGANGTGANGAGAGNLFGESQDFTKINSFDLSLAEEGRPQNEVGFTVKVIEGTLKRNGFFHRATQDSFDFNSIKNLPRKEWEEMVIAAAQIVDYHVQIAVLLNAGNNYYAGSAYSRESMRGTLSARTGKTIQVYDDPLASDTAALGDMHGSITAASGSDPAIGASVVTYGLLQKVSAQLDRTETPRDTNIVVGSNMVGTVTLPNTRFAFIDADLIPTLEMIKDRNGENAWRPIESFAYASQITSKISNYGGSGVLDGVVGSIGNLTFVVVPKMVRYHGAGSSTLADPANAAFTADTTLVAAVDAALVIFNTAGGVITFPNSIIASSGLKIASATTAKLVTKSTLDLFVDATTDTAVKVAAASAFIAVREALELLSSSNDLELSGQISNDGTFRATSGKYDVYPIVVIGSESFYNITWQSKVMVDNQEIKGNLKILERKPFISDSDPYASTWLKSIQWWEGTLFHHPERIAVINTLAYAV